MDYKKIAIIGGALAGASAIAYFFLRSGKNETVRTGGGKIYSREVILATLKSLKKELFTVCLQMSLMASEMKKYSQGRLDYDIKDFIFSYPAINQEMQSSIKKAYDANSITEVDFQFNCEVTFAEDKEIQTQIKAIKQMVDDSADGKELDTKTNIPEFLTQDKLLEIIERIMKDTTKAMQQIFKKIKDQYGELNLNDPKIHRQLQTLEVDKIKTSIFNDYNLENFEDPAQKIISFATQKYSTEQPDFQEKMMQLELKQRKSMEIIMQNPDSDDIVDKIFNEPAEVPMGMGNGQFQGFHANRKRNVPAPKAEVKVEEKPKVEDPFAEIKQNSEENSAEEKKQEQETLTVNAEEKVEEAAQKVEEVVAEKVEEVVAEKVEEVVAEKVEEVVAEKVEEVADEKVEHIEQEQQVQDSTEKVHEVSVVDEVKLQEESNQQEIVEVQSSPRHEQHHEESSPSHQH